MLVIYWWILHLFGPFALSPVALQNIASSSQLISIYLENHRITDPESSWTVRVAGFGAR